MTTLITLAWELYTQGLSKSCIAQRLGKDRGTIRLWIEAITDKGLLPFLAQHQTAKKQPRPTRQVRPATKQLIWAIREREQGCCGQKNQKRGDAPEATAARQVIQMDTVHF